MDWIKSNALTLISMLCVGAGIYASNAVAIANLDLKVQHIEESISISMHNDKRLSLAESELISLSADVQQLQPTIQQLNNSINDLTVTLKKGEVTAGYVKERLTDLRKNQRETKACLEKIKDKIYAS